MSDIQHIVRRQPWYSNPTFLWILKSTAVNFILPFFNGVMLGFGEILANETLFKYGWFGYSRPAIGIYGGSATSEYKKTVQNQIKHEQQQKEKQILLLD